MGGTKGGLGSSLLLLVTAPLACFGLNQHNPSHSRCSRPPGISSLSSFPLAFSFASFSDPPALILLPSHPSRPSLVVLDSWLFRGQMAWWQRLKEEGTGRKREGRKGRRRRAGAGWAFFPLRFNVVSDGGAVRQGSFGAVLPCLLAPSSVWQTAFYLTTTHRARLLTSCLSFSLASSLNGRGWEGAERRARRSDGRALLRLKLTKKAMTNEQTRDRGTAESRVACRRFNDSNKSRQDSKSQSESRQATSTDDSLSLSQGSRQKNKA